MNKQKVAKAISAVTNPPIICIPLFLIICTVLSFENGTFNISKFAVLELISLIFTSALPLAIILLWAKRIGTDRDISNRSDRYMPLIIGIISYIIGFMICIIFNLDHFLTALLLCYATNTGVVLLFTIKWKISVHTTALSDLVKSSFKKAYPGSGDIRRRSGILPDSSGDVSFHIPFKSSGSASGKSC